MLINIKLRQRTDIDLEFIFIRQMFRKIRVQTMNSFYDKYIIFSKLLCLLSIFLMTGEPNISKAMEEGKDLLKQITRSRGFGMGM